MRVFGYPVSLLNLKFDYAFMMRGLIVDKKRGNIIKVCLCDLDAVIYPYL